MCANGAHGPPERPPPSDDDPEQLTPLQRAQACLNAAFLVAVEELDECGVDAFLDIAATKIAKARADRLASSWRRAA